MNGYDLIRDMAHYSVGRACMFTLLGIVTFMMGMMGWPDLAMRSGAILFLLTTVVLVLKAAQAPTRSYRRTEVWILIDKRHDLPEARAQAIFGEVLRNTYIRFAKMTLKAAVVLWMADIAIRLSGLAPR
ncbi:MAG: hypothetical protein FJX54_06875 [Alphaproteobacteria bacterium]|nr:hypothetical protein [Alphaproteobacteria bacterium]